MPRFTVRPPTYRRHKASGLAVVTLDSRDHYLGAYGSPESREKYNTLVGRWQLRRATPEAHPACDDLTLNELFVRYWQHALRHYRKNGQPTDQQRLIKATMRYLLPAFGTMNVSEFGPLDLKVVRESMIKTGLSRIYINQSIDRIRRMFRWGVENELVPSGVLHGLIAVAGLRRGRSDALETGPVLPADEPMIEAAIPNMATAVSAMVRLQMMTGMRPGEVVCIRPRDVDWSTDPWVYTPESHKTEHHGRPRRVYLGPKAQEVLAPFLLRGVEVYCFSPADATAKRLAERHSRRVTQLGYGNRPGSNRKAHPRRTPGEKYSVNSYRRAIDRACDAAFPPPPPLAKRAEETTAQWRARLTPAQLDELLAWRRGHRFHPHQLRHNAATFLAKVYGIEAAQVVLGHTTLSVTGIYAERDFAKAAAIMRQVG